MSTSPYPGRKLSECEIRLIKLRPGKWSDPIRCSLSYLDLSENVLYEKRHIFQYQALSYVWGSPKVTRPIWLDDIEYGVTVNLESALRHLRHMYPDITLWVDAVCIRQDDADERTRQVNMMGSIYRSCERALVYLGDNLGQIQRTKLPGPEDSPPLSTHFQSTDEDIPIVEGIIQDIFAPGQRSKKVQSAVQVFALIRALSRDKHLDSIPAFKVDGDGDDSINMHLFEALRRLMHAPWTPWWNRIWVVQEVAMPRDVVVLYGTVSAPWSTFARAAASYLSHSDSCCSAITQRLPRDQVKVLVDFSNRVTDIEELRSDFTKAPTSEEDGTVVRGNLEGTLLPLLRKFRSRQSSDARDKVYALLSLVRRRHKLIMPNYRFSVAQVFQKATLEAIYASGSLSVLASDLGRKFRRDLPTWVPDWDAPGDHAQAAARANASELYNTHPKIFATEANVREIGVGVLQISAAKLAVVEEVFAVMWGDSAASARDTIEKWWRAVHRRAWTAIERTGADFWRLLCADVICMGASGETQRSSSMRRSRPEDEALFVAWSLKAERAPVRRIRVPRWHSHAGRIKDKSYWTDAALYDLLGDKELSEYGAAWRGLLYRSPQGGDQAKDEIEQEMTINDLLPNHLRGSSETCILSYMVERPEWHDFAHAWAGPSMNELLAGEKFQESDLREGLGNRALTVMDNSIMTATLSRRLFVTSTGSVGLGPADMQGQDTIHFLRGGRTPFVLRETFNGTYQVVGDCYLHTSMDDVLHGHEWCTIELT